MDDNRYRKFYVEWWNIQKSTIYGLIALALFAGLIGGGAWWASRNNWFIQTNEAEMPADAARIISFEGEVRIVRAQTRETLLVTRETWVAAGDTIQTQSDGRAIVQMIDGSVYSVRPNSTVVVRDSTSIFGGKNVRVSLNDGQLNVRTDEQPEDSKNIVEVAESENRLLPKTDASFNADETGGEIRISRGGVETTIGGDKTMIGENEFASVNGGKLSARERLLAPPRPSAPSNSSQLVDSSGAGVSVAFNWQDSEAGNAVSFYLQVSRSSYFASDSILVDRTGLTSREFRLSGLSPGTYYWRLKSTAGSGQTTNWNEPWKFTVIKGGGNISIEASGWAAERVGGIVYIISGTTRPGAVVRAQGRETFAGPDGVFRMQIATPSAETKVEISDDRGNRSGFVLSLRSGKVTGRY
ncbi:MAG: FecR domain-containing protein [Pyrinomonadaceae bacterium]|nr:FecR domain-containing protein [Pyrinomonadaceae bacterium]MBP6212857.1 FecR domain-containing protein [Pyrinomonadaceae bacterium]